MFENRHSHSSFAPPVAGPPSGIQSFTAFFKHGEDQIRQGLSSVVQWPSFLSGSSSLRPGGDQGSGTMQHQLRAQQLRSLRQLVPNIGQITHDESQWSLKLVDAQHQLLTQIFVTLPLQFPSAAPDIRVSPLVDHPWVDRDGAIVGHPSVGRNWHPGRDLGIVMAEVLNEFTQRAPRSVGTNSIPSAGGGTSQQPQMVSPPAGLNPGHSYQFQATARTPPSTSPHHHGQEGASSGGPTGATASSAETASQNNELIIPERFPEIDGLADEHLEYLKSAEREAFQEFLQETADFQEMKSKLITVMEANMLLTKQTLQKEPNLLQLEKEVAEGASKVVGERAVVLALEERRDELRKMFSRKQQAQRLHLAHLSAHEEAEALHRLDGKGAGETRKKYFEARKREHRLAAQKDRMRELLEEYG